MNAYVANFNAETYWREEQLCKLPAMDDNQADKITGTMDELQFAFVQNPEELVVTRIPMNDYHVDYLNSIGIKFNYTRKPFSVDSTTLQYFKENIFECVYKQLKSTPEFERVTSISPFAIVPFTQEIQSHIKGQPLPSLAIVKNVNSKAYSHKMVEQLFGKAVGKLVYSSDELMDVGKEYLSTGPILVKDVFGVSGKGNMKIESELFLNRIVKHVKKQEASGKSTCFIVEPFLEKLFDFCCQFKVEANGSVSIISTHKLSNSGFSFSGSKHADQEFMDQLEKRGYYATMTSIGKQLHQDGYFGDVCIDSMYLKGDDIVSIVEINARKSMSLINHNVDRFITSCTGKRGTLISYMFNIPQEVSFEQFAGQLKKKNILFNTTSNSGLLPLTANTFGVNRSAETDSVSKGQLYASLIGKNEEEEISILSELKEICSSLKITVL